MVLIPHITPVKTGGQVDFSPISNAISENRLMGFRQKQFDANQKHRAASLGMQKERLGMERQRFDAQRRDQEIKKAAGVAQMILDNPDQQAASQQWQSLLASNPDYQGAVSELGLDPMDYRSGAQALIAEARGYVDPQEAEMNNLNMELKRAQINRANRVDQVDPLEAQIQQERLKKLQQGNAMDGLINRLLSGAQQPKSGDAQLYKQSLEGDGYTPKPGVQLTAGGAPDAQPQSQEQMVDTPLGQMPASKARQLGFAMAMGGRGDAGRMFTDPIQKQQLGKAASNENDKQQFNSINALSRLDEISALVDEKFLTIDNKLKNYGVSWMDSIGPLRDQVSPEARQELVEFTKFRRSAVDNMNRYIKEITGAQMSEAEANRLRKAVPDPERDGPTQFKAKLDDAKKSTRLAIIRYSYLRKNGFSGSAEQAAQQVPLQQMSRIVDEIGEKALQQIKAQNPGLDERAARNAAKQLMQQELGLGV